MSDSDEEPIRFGETRSALHEIAIIGIQGGTQVSLEEGAQKRYQEIMAANRENLALAVFKELNIPLEMQGQAVEPRALCVVGHTKPWTMDICTTTTIQPLVHHFGANLDGTVCMDLKVRCITDIKTRSTVYSSAL